MINNIIKGENVILLNEVAKISTKIYTSILFKKKLGGPLPLLTHEWFVHVCVYIFIFLKIYSYFFYNFFKIKKILIKKDVLSIFLIYNKLDIKKKIPKEKKK